MHWASIRLTTNPTDGTDASDVAPLLRVLLDEPGLISGYASAYAVLLRQDAAGWHARKMRRLGYLLAVASGVLLALLFTGIALMLYAVTGNGHWVLWASLRCP